MCLMPEDAWRDLRPSAGTDALVEQVEQLAMQRIQTGTLHGGTHSAGLRIGEVTRTRAGVIARQSGSIAGAQ